MRINIKLNNKKAEAKFKPPLSFSKNRMSFVVFAGERGIASKNNIEPKDLFSFNAEYGKCIFFKNKFKINFAKIYNKPAKASS